MSRSNGSVSFAATGASSSTVRLLRPGGLLSHPSPPFYRPPPARRGPRHPRSLRGPDRLTWPLAPCSPAAEKLRHEAADAHARPDAGPRGDAAGAGPPGVLPPLGPDAAGAGRGAGGPPLRLLHPQPGAAADLLRHRRHG